MISKDHAAILLLFVYTNCTGKETPKGCSFAIPQAQDVDVPFGL